MSYIIVRKMIQMNKEVSIDEISLYPKHLERPLLVLMVWTIVLFGYHLFLPKYFSGGLNYSDAPFVSAGYYFLACVFTFLVFRNELKDIYETGWFKPEYKDFAVFTALVPIIFYFILTYGSVSKLLGPSLVELVPVQILYALPKTIEIFFQQILILLMVFWLFEWIHKPYLVVATFAIGFSAMHLLLRLVMDEGAAEYFTIAASFGGPLFAWLILKKKNGFFYSYFTHWSFYLATLAFVYFLI